MAVTAARNAITMLREKKPKNIVNPEVFESPVYPRKLRS
jgi:hypothetical protein